MVGEQEGKMLWLFLDIQQSIKDKGLKSSFFPSFLPIYEKFGNGMGCNSRLL